MRLLAENLAQRWFTLTTPDNLVIASVYERERFRKAHLLSMAIFPLMFVTMMSLLITSCLRELDAILIDCSTIAMISWVIQLNRKGHLYLAGFVFILGYIVACSCGLQLAYLLDSSSVAYAWAFLTLAPLLAGFILPVWAPFLFSFLSLVNMSVIYEFDFLHGAPALFRHPKDQIILLIIATIVLLAIATLMAIYVHSMEKAVVEADRAVELEQVHHELTLAYQRLETTATHDPITDLLNHRALYQHLQNELAESNRGHERLISVIFADLDHFKQINDTWGHQIGDSVLKHVAGILTTSVCDSDTVGRYGGEEFIIVLPDQDQAGALLVAEGVRMMIAQTPLNLLDGHHIALTLSLAPVLTTRVKTGAQDPFCSCLLQYIGATLNKSLLISFLLVTTQDRKREMDSPCKAAARVAKRE